MSTLSLWSAMPFIIMTGFHALFLENPAALFFAEIFEVLGKTGHVVRFPSDRQATTIGVFVDCRSGREFTVTVLAGDEEMKKVCHLGVAALISSDPH